MAPYREAGQNGGVLACPRCAKKLPALDLAACPAECGIWITADVAAIGFTEEELLENRMIRWERIREPCPVCHEQMLLRGFDEAALFQGCARHGYWVDADATAKTGLARPGVTATLRSWRADRERDESERRAKAARAAEQAEQAIATATAAREAREQRAAEEKARKETERRAQAERDALAAEQAKARAAVERAAREKREAEALAIRRAELTACVEGAIASGNVAPLVDKLLRLEVIVEDLVRRTGKLDVS